MAVSDIVAGNLTAFYVAVIACIKAYGVVSGRSFSGGFILVVATTVVGLLLVAALTWDVSRKATYAFTTHTQMCKGGICWHGVSQLQYPPSQIRFTLPHHIPF